MQLVKEREEELLDVEDQPPYADSLSEADRDILEQAVRWVIITIIFVFDPLAVLLLIASQYTFEWNRKPKVKKPEPAPEPVEEETADEGDA